MGLKKWKKISSEDKFVNPWWTYRFDKFELPSGKEGEYHYVHTGGCAFMIPVLDNGNILMVKQYRYLIDRESIELPAGGIKEGEDAEEIAHKELIEETGMDGDLEKVGELASFNGISDEMMNVFIVRNLKPSDLHSRDETEEFEYIELSPQEIDDKIASGEINDSMSIASWALVKNRLT